MVQSTCLLARTISWRVRRCSLRLPCLLRSVSIAIVTDMFSDVFTSAEEVVCSSSQNVVDEFLNNFRRERPWNKYSRLYPVTHKKWNIDTSVHASPLRLLDLQKACMFHSFMRRQTSIKLVYKVAVGITVLTVSINSVISHITSDKMLLTVPRMSLALLLSGTHCRITVDPPNFSALLSVA